MFQSFRCIVFGLTEAFESSPYVVCPASLETLLFVLEIHLFWIKDFHLIAGLTLEASTRFVMFAN